MQPQRRWIPSVTDAVVGGLLLVYVVYELFDGSGRVPHHYPLQIVIGALCTVPVVWRRRWPVATYVVVCTAFGGKALLMHPMSQPLAEVLGLTIVLYTVGARLELRRSLWLLAYGLVCGGLRAYGSPEFGIGGNIVNEAFAVAPWAIGRVVRVLESRATVSEQRVAVVEDWAAESSREAVQDERLRIARELHDIVAHNIGVVLLHAGGGRRMLDHDPERSREAFDTIETAASDALAETRRLLNVLRADHDQLTRQPTVADVPALVDRVRAAGVDVELVADPVEHVSPGLGLCVYRIVQEATTNAVRHGAAHRIVVRLEDAGDAVVLHVTDDGAPTGEVSPGGGHGIVGMRERVALFGGSLTVGPEAGGGFGVHARFPKEPS